MCAQPVVVALSGNVLEYVLSLAYVVGGALLGSPAGAEFLAARDAADQARLHHSFKCCTHVLGTRSVFAVGLQQDPYINLAHQFLAYK